MKRCLEAHELDGLAQVLAPNITFLCQARRFGDGGIGAGEQFFGLFQSVCHGGILT